MSECIRRAERLYSQRKVRDRRMRHTMNRLKDATSPYLRQHADNPVDWYTWGEEAFARARQDDKPILLSIGYSACHWCHVMAHESFEDPDTAAQMNRRFREHQGGPRRAPRRGRYLHAGDADLQPGAGRLADDGLPDAGWPPVSRRDVFPPGDRYGMPSFRRVMAAVVEAYRNRRERDRRTGRRDHRRAFSAPNWASAEATRR